MLMEAAHDAGRAFTSTLSREQQRELGQFMTPPAIATFMARRLVAGVASAHVRVLEPAAGSGVLAAAVVEELLALAHPPGHIELQLYEIDPRLPRICDPFVSRCARSVRGRAFASIGTSQRATFWCRTSHSMAGRSKA